MSKQKFDIQGMTCSSCSSHVENAVRSLDGVKNVNVNLLSNNMNVEYDEHKLTDQNIILAVEKAGYGATLSNENIETREVKKINNENTNNLKKRLIISILFLLPLMYLSMYHMLKEYLGIPIPNFIKNLFHGSENAVTYVFTQFLLLLPILFINRNFYIVRV